MKKLLLVIPFLLATSCPGCPDPSPTQQKWIDCASDAVKKNGIPLIPKVNDCLTGLSITSCLISLLSPAAGITEDVLACVVQSSAMSFAESADDPLECGAAEAADQFIQEEILKKRGWQFKDGYTPARLPADCGE